MGVLKRIADGSSIHLPADALLGRGEDHDVPLMGTRASAPHARLRWTKGHWQLCDLASLNGTYINQVRMASGQRATVEEGDRLLFGSSGEGLTLVDAGPPSPLARQVGSGHTRPLEGEVLLLPNDDDPKVCLYLDQHGTLVIEAGERQSRAVDREVVQVGQQLWQIRTLVAERPTTLHSPRVLAIDTVTANFTPSASQEHVKLALTSDGQRIHVKPRAFHYLLLILARVRRDDACVSESDRGWIDRDELCRMLKTRAELLNVDIYRARRQFSGLGLLGAANVIERRSTSRELRFGIQHIQIEE